MDQGIGKRRTRRSALRWLMWLSLLAAAVVFSLFIIFVVIPARTIPALEPVDEYVYLDQGWGTSADSAGRQTYYYTPQGASLPQGALTTALRYDWFVHLEMPMSQERFADPHHLRRYRFIVDPRPTPANPDQLPIGFTRHYAPAIGENVLDITCAACHSGELHVRKNGRNYAVRIDGGQAMHAFADMQRGSFAPTLVASLIATYLNPAKFDRFAKKVLAGAYPTGKSVLHGQLRQTIDALVTEGQNNPFRHLYPVEEGYGRTDALGRIANTVFGDHLVPGNYQAGTAPVSYPYVWNIWKFDWVQYAGSVRQPLARNIGEALGVGATLRMRSDTGLPLPPEERFDSSVRVPDLMKIEHTLQRLRPPRWPEPLFGAIDQAKAERGRARFETLCQGCHGPHPASRAQQLASAPDKPSPDVEWKIEVVPLEHIGTDPTSATAFVERRYDLSSTGVTNQELATLIRPLRIRQLARDARYRLTEVVEARKQAGQPSDVLAALLTGYPDPDADATPTLPTETFAAIVEALGGSQNIPKAQPAAGWQCALDCQTAWLGWSALHGAAQIETDLKALDVRRLSEGQGLNVIGLFIKQKYFADRGIGYAEQQCIEGFGTLDLPQQIAGYKPRPLEGVWATPPFLHNGAVPTIYEMLLPPEKRSVRFYVGPRQYDTKRLGYVTTAPKDSDGDRDGFWLDTTKPGNHNTGHAFAADRATWEQHRQNPQAHPLPPGVIGPLLDDTQRYELLEYLKVHRDLPGTPENLRLPSCARDEAAA